MGTAWLLTCPASVPLQVCLWTGVTCSPEGRIESL